ncbi:MAG: CBS domain-containing protein [Pseudonocardiaceae bacterium]
MKIEGIITKKGWSVQTIQPWSTVAEAVHRLAGPPRIGALVVTGSDGQITGMITERDIVRGLERHGGQLLDRQVSDVMEQHVPVCSPQDSIDHVMLQMTRLRYRHLPVIDERGQLAGLVSIGDAVKHRIDELRLETDVLRDLYIASR